MNILPQIGPLTTGIFCYLDDRLNAFWPELNYLFNNQLHDLHSEQLFFTHNFNSYLFLYLTSHVDKCAELIRTMHLRGSFILLGDQLNDLKNQFDHLLFIQL